jgi:hypothetical protein
MPALAPPPPPPLQPAARPQLELPSVSFFGRTFAEYTRFFALDPVALRGRDILDVAAGPSSFVAEACARRIAAVAVDPLYGNTADTLATRIEHDYEAMAAQIRANARLFRTRGPAAVFPSLAAAEAERRGAAQRFLADYEAQFFHGRYVCGSLPRLPFLDGTFDLVICAHLPFVYARRFDFDWHLAACRELVRVAAGEVRIHPLCGLDGRTYSGLPRLRRELRASGIASEVVRVDYEFFAGSDSMLVLRKAAP